MSSETVTNLSSNADSPGMNSTEELIEDIRLGKMVIILDDEDRENEGDLVMAASMVRPEDINFMARYGRGLICLTLTRERCRQLRLPLMVSENEDLHQTRFTVSIEAAEGVTTGISAADRAKTVRAAVHADAGPQDIVMPGHVFPLMAQPGGVLARAGHTEAGCDLARLAGLEPSAVIVEILNEDGSMARRPDLEKFAAHHGLKIGTIENLIRYRSAIEHTVIRRTSQMIKTKWGEFELIAYEDEVDRAVHLALRMGDIDPEDPTLVRVHVRNTLNDVLAVEHPDFGWPLRSALQRVGREGKGVVVVLRKPVSTEEMISQIQDLGETQQSDSGEEGQAGKGADPRELRTYGIGAQILTDLGVRRMRVLSAPLRMHALAGFGLEVVDYVPTEV